MTTGIIRRIDELEKIGIPKEIRKKLRIDNGESLEILIEDDNIILKKYSPVESLNDVVNKYVDIFSQVIKCNIIVVDRKKVIGVSSNIKKQYQDKDITEFTLRSIDRRDNFVERQKKEFNFVEQQTDSGYYSFSSIVNNGDAIGAVIILSTEYQLSEIDEKIAVILARILSKHFV